MEWIYLVAAGFLEVGWATGLKYSQGFTRIFPSILTVTGMVASFYFLSLSIFLVDITLFLPKHIGSVLSWECSCHQMKRRH